MKTYLLLTLLLCITLLNAQTHTIHVSPKGRVSNDGSENNPVNSFDGAIALLKKVAAEKNEIDTIKVLFREGTYRINKTVALDGEELGIDVPVVFKNYNNQEVVISGAVALNNYNKLSKSHPLYQKNPEVGKKILVFDLAKSDVVSFEKMRLAGFQRNNPPKPADLQEVYFNGKAMPLSRWPNEGYIKAGKYDTSSKDASDSKVGIYYEDDRISTWANEPNVILHGYWYWTWADAFEHPFEFDTTNKIMWVDAPFNIYGYGRDGKYVGMNIKTEIDMPGEWAYDYQEKKVYFYPPEKVGKNAVEFSVCKQTMVSISDMSNVTFEGLNFQKSAGAAFVIDDSENITIKSCNISGCATEAVRMNGGKNNSIISCHITDLGRGAIALVGGDRMTLEPANYLIDNCYIHHTSRIDRTYTPGVRVDGVGTTIRHCEFHDIPSSAVRLNGNDHLIEYNYMYRVVYESPDQGAIDMWGDPTFRGNTIRYNYFKDICPLDGDKSGGYHGRAGVRLDDAISGTFIYGNIFRNASYYNFGALQINGGKDNLAWNNIFYQCNMGITIVPWKHSAWLKFLERDFIEVLRASKEVQALYKRRYPDMVRLRSTNNCVNSFVENVFIECNEIHGFCDPQRGPAPANVKERDYIVPKEKTVGIDLEKKSFDSELIYELIGDTAVFEPIPFDKIGLRN